MVFSDSLPAATALWRRDHDQTEPFDRRSGIGASETPALFGLSPWTTARELYGLKTGELPERVANDAMNLGTLLEEPIRVATCRRLGRTCVKPPTRRHAVHPYVYASPDGLFDERTGLECKNVGPSHAAEWGPAGTDSIPDGVNLQVHQQMEVYGLGEVVVAALVCGNDLRLYNVGRHDGLVGCILAACREFWQRVQDRRPPDPDFAHPSTPALLSALYGVDGGTVSLGAEFVPMIDLYEDLGKDLREAEKIRAVQKARILHAMGAAAVGVLPDGRTVCRREVKRAGYSVEPCSYIDFRIKQPKKVSA
jgi:putative phage-type endonuclease